MVGRLTARRRQRAGPGGPCERSAGAALAMEAAGKRLAMGQPVSVPQSLEARRQAGGPTKAVEDTASSHLQRRPRTCFDLIEVEEKGSRTGGM